MSTRLIGGPHDGEVLLQPHSADILEVATIEEGAPATMESLAGRVLYGILGTTGLPSSGPPIHVKRVTRYRKMETNPDCYYWLPPDDYNPFVLPWFNDSTYDRGI